MSSQPERYDMVVLGSGEAGKYLAWDAAASGRKTALIERRYIGGSCPNIACLPSKNIIHSASVAHLARQARDFGLQAPPPGVDMEVIRGRKRRMVEDLMKIHVERFERTGVELIRGEGRFVDRKSLK
ncbi:MAG TPA: FAD-dependent oxidoreductase [Bryobacteraceae bacterium]|jgi:pyruvate/2-oxoglutarate dehydrogenase complex dihydrolipoamide dehydrogenase (E3) component